VPFFDRLMYTQVGKL